MTVPYYAFLDAGLKVDIASIEGAARSLSSRGR
jgi:putative intracellular protease/amidase